MIGVHPEPDLSRRHFVDCNACCASAFKFESCKELYPVFAILVVSVKLGSGHACLQSKKVLHARAITVLLVPYMVFIPYMFVIPY